MVLTCILQHLQSSLSILDGEHIRSFGRVETEATLVVTLSGEVVVDAGRYWTGGGCGGRGSVGGDSVGGWGRRVCCWLMLGGCLGERFD